MKRIVCSFDGTWDEPTDEATLTNVVKLHRAISPYDSRGVQQVTHYEIGIATDGGGKGLGNFIKGAIGVEVGLRIQSAYKFVAETYEPGDEIHLFGFSRGAFEARSLGGLLSHVGLPRNPGASALLAAWTAYETRRMAGGRTRIAAARETSHHPVQIKCIGVWDTVGNLGIPLLLAMRYNRRFAFHDVRLTPNVEVALHALAIDEPRGPFSPALWTMPKRQHLPPHQHVEQVWFPGSHCDVGGGRECSDLSDGALIWMASRAHQATGLAFDFDRLEATARPNPLGEQLWPSGRLYRLGNLLPYLRLINQDTRAVPVLRRVTFGNWRTGPLQRGRHSINERIHPSAIERFGKSVAVRRGEEVRVERYLPPTLALALASGMQRVTAAPSREIDA